MRRLYGHEGRWDAYFWFVGWDCISFGLHVSLTRPNLEVHVPFGFFRVGRGCPHFGKRLR